MASDRKIGRNTTKCARYRAYVGKPLGPGKTGTKAGKKSHARSSS